MHDIVVFLYSTVDTYIHSYVHVSVHVCVFYIPELAAVHCKNKLVVLTTEWLP